MGSGKKESARKERQGKTADSMANVKTKGENFYRNAKKIKTLNMFKDGKPQRNASGRITKSATYQSRDKPNARVEPNRKWFNNSRVIAQDSLTQFRDAVAKSQSDPYSYLLKQNKLPMSLIRDNKAKNGLKQHDAKMTVETSPFSDTFGPKAQRKRVKLGVGSLEDLVGHSEKMHEEYRGRRENAKVLNGEEHMQQQDTGSPLEDDGEAAVAVDAVFSKGQSKRIWNELYKVIDSSDVVIHVLDARDPQGTRCRHVEKYIKEETPHKHLLLLLNKCDLIPTAVAASWVRTLSKEYPTLAFHASITNSFGKGSLIQVLRQFSQLHSNRKQVSVSFIGYPNTGKSSIINTLRKKKVCQVAPVPGETKVWQYITLMKRIYLIDCPGVVPPNQNDTPEDVLLRGAIRVEKVSNPEQYVAAALQKCKAHHVQRTYGVEPFSDATDFLEILARKSGRLLKGGEADLDGVAKMVLNDFLRGKIPWFTPPPLPTHEGDGTKQGQADRTGTIVALNKAPTMELRTKKRKRDSEKDGDAASDHQETESLSEHDDEAVGHDSESISNATDSSESNGQD